MKNKIKDDMFLSDEGPTLETLDSGFYIGSTQNVLYFDKDLFVFQMYPFDSLAWSTWWWLVDGVEAAVCVHWCIVIFLQVDCCLLKPQKRFELNWFSIVIITTERLDLRWLPTVSWKVGEMQMFAFSNLSLGYFRKEKNPWNGRGVAAYAYF